MLIRSRFEILGTKRLGSKTVGGAVVLALMLSACGGENLAKSAEERADQQCACTDFECTLENTQWFNRVGITQADDVDELSAEDSARWAAARSRSADCQNELRE